MYLYILLAVLSFFCLIYFGALLLSAYSLRICLFGEMTPPFSLDNAPLYLDNFPCFKVCFFWNYCSYFTFILTVVNMLTLSPSLYFNRIRVMPFPHISGTRFWWYLFSWRASLCCGIGCGPILQRLLLPSPCQSHEERFLCSLNHEILMSFLGIKHMNMWVNP